MKHAGGIAAKIMKNAGKKAFDESDKYIAKYREVFEGRVAVTNAGKLPCNYIIH